MEDIGWKCNNCASLNKHLELDLEFGKRREMVTCGTCDADLRLEDQEKLYLESSIVTDLKRNLELIESLSQQTKSEAAGKEVKGRRREILSTAKTLGLKEKMVDGEGVRKCVFCGVSNSVENDSCAECGESSWMAGELEK